MIDFPLPSEHIANLVFQVLNVDRDLTAHTRKTLRQEGSTLILWVAWGGHAQLSSHLLVYI